MYKKCITYIFLFNIFIQYAQSISLQTEYDSINKLISFSTNVDSSLTKRLSYALKAKELAEQTNIDTIILSSYRSLSRMYLNLDENYEFGKLNRKHLNISEKIQDTINLAFAYNNLGYYHTTQSKSDSAYFYYFNALKFYKNLNNTNRQVSILRNMAGLQEEARDYIGAETNTFAAIDIVEKFKDSDDKFFDLWSLNNLIGLASTGLQDYEKALEYYLISLEYASKVSGGEYIELLSKINIAETYNDLGEYNESILYYERLLENEDLKNIDLDIYVKVLNNIASIKLINNNDNSDEVYDFLNESYKLNENLDDPRINKIGISSSLGEYFLSKQIIDSAVYYADQALNISKELNSNQQTLTALELISRIKGGEDGLKYLNEHRLLSDSLLQRERAYRNKFARIEYETDQLEADNAALSKERLLFLLLSIGLMLSLTLLYIVITQRSRNKELRFKQEQQEANEEIYNLMLAQQDKIEEGRTKEKKRISQELHDGVLGRLFGTRLSLDSLNMVNTNEAIENREQYINELKTIEQDIRKISHDLNTDFIGGSNFMDIVKNLVETQTAAYGLEYHFSDDETINWDKFSNKNKIHIYRMLQECMQNIYKHAQAKSINIGFALKNNVILVSVEDDGVGFNIDRAKKGIGIKNINSRVEELKGQVDIKSEIGKGTSIVISIPY